MSKHSKRHKRERLRLALLEVRVSGQRIQLERLKEQLRSLSWQIETQQDESMRLCCCQSYPEQSFDIPPKAKTSQTTPMPDMDLKISYDTSQ